MKIAIDCGFRHHHANEKYSWLNLCLSKSHSVADCPYPLYKTISAGVTGIVFNPTRDKVLMVKEKVGITKIKPPTGGVDYGESQETPLDAVVRELFEEAKIRVKKEDAQLVGTAWTNNYRGNSPDISYFYAFVLNQEQVPSAQESEILSVQWMDVEESKKEPEDEKDKPWSVRHAVIAADAVVNGFAAAWKPSTKYLTTGKPIEFYSVIPTKTHNRD